jgi:restriction endonuclease S subunit
MRLGDLIAIKTNDPSADFWIIRRGDKDRVGTPVKEYSPEAYGITVTSPDIIAPKFLYYLIQYAHSTGYFSKRARGATRLVNITIDDIKGIELS